MSDEPDKSPHSGEGAAWSLVSTLVAGPLVWGTVGHLVDRAIGSRITFLILGLAVGFVAAFYILYVRHGRD